MSKIHDPSVPSSYVIQVQNMNEPAQVYYTCGIFWLVAKKKKWLTVTTHLHEESIKYTINSDRGIFYRPLLNMTD